MSRLPVDVPTWELPVWITLGVWALLPGSRTPVVDVGTVPVSAKHALLLALAFYLVLLRVRAPERARGWPAWQFVLPIGFVAYIGYAFTSLFWADLPTRDAAGMTVSLVLSLAALAGAYALVALHSRDTLPGLLWRLTVYLALVGALYTAESYFSLGLRGEDPLDFGIDRVRGPLFSSASGHLALLPALGMAAQEMVRTRFRSVTRIAASVALAITVLGLGSRAATFALVLFVVLAALSVEGLRRRVAVAAVIAAVIAVAGVVLFARADPTRLLSLQDDVRRNTHDVGFSIMADRGPVENLRGGGLGSTWPWYIDDLEGQNIGERTSYGFTLFHPHSVPLFSAVELGLPGLALLGLVLGFVVYRATGRRAHGPYAILGAAIAASVTAVFFDHFLVRLYLISALWWAFVFAFLRMSAAATAPPPDQARPLARTAS